jgi:hypothetical protein
VFLPLRVSASGRNGAISQQLKGYKKAFCYKVKKELKIKKSLKTALS